jgi:hypothetical protein
MPRGREDIGSIWAGISRASDLSDAFELALDLEDLVLFRAGTSSLVDRSEPAWEVALVLVVFVDAVDFRLGTSGNMEYVDSDLLCPRSLLRSLEGLLDLVFERIKLSDSASDTTFDSACCSLSNVDFVGVGGISRNCISSKSLRNKSGNRVFPSFWPSYIFPRTEKKELNQSDWLRQDITKGLW